MQGASSQSLAINVGWSWNRCEELAVVAFKPAPTPVPSNSPDPQDLWPSRHESLRRQRFPLDARLRREASSLHSDGHRSVPLETLFCFAP